MNILTIIGIFIGSMIGGFIGVILYDFINKDK